MTDPEREHMRQYIAELEHSRSRWRLTALVLGLLWAVPIVLIGLLGVMWVPAAQMQRARAEEAEMMAREEAERARAALQQAEWSRHLAEEQRQRAEKAQKDTGPSTPKDKK
jgi:hypothetical protein